VRYIYVLFLHYGSLKIQKCSSFPPTPKKILHSYIFLIIWYLLCLRRFLFMKIHRRLRKNNFCSSSFYCPVWSLRFHFTVKYLLIVTYFSFDEGNLEFTIWDWGIIILLYFLARTLGFHLVVNVRVCYLFQFWRRKSWV